MERWFSLGREWRVEICEVHAGGRGDRMGGFKVRSLDAFAVVNAVLNEGGEKPSDILRRKIPVMISSHLLSRPHHHHHSDYSPDLYPMDPGVPTIVCSTL